MWIRSASRIPTVVGQPGVVHAVGPFRLMPAEGKLALGRHTAGGTPATKGRVPTFGTGLLLQRMLTEQMMNAVHDFDFDDHFLHCIFVLMKTPPLSDDNNTQ